MRRTGSAKPPTRDVAAEFSVAAVVRLTGLSEHVLRAWERRHRAVVPWRSSGGTRRYSAADVARLRLLAAGVASGHPIRRLAPLDDAALEVLLKRPEPVENPHLAALFAALDRLDLGALERQLGLQLSALGARPFLDEIAVPFLREVGSRWERGDLRPSEEHAASAALHAVLARAQRALGGPAANGLVLATLPGERHEFGILMAALCAQEHDVRVLYLGCDLPVDEVAEAARRSGARVVGIGIVALEPAIASRELRSLRRELPASVALWVGGAGAARLDSVPEGTVLISDLASLDTRLALLAEPARGRRA
jgi:DNA-binding transcriptional MerR regulator/methylmalonyl-CoA mutase cobalamin-binding subunit